MAELAGSSFYITYDEESIEIYFKSYSDKIEEFMDTCLNKLKEFDASKSEDIFKLKKEAWLKDKRNLSYDDPNDQLETLLTQVLITNNFTTPHLISIGEKFTFERFVELSNQFLIKGRHLWFSIGNITGKVYLH